MADSKSSVCPVPPPPLLPRAGRTRAAARTPAHAELDRILRSAAPPAREPPPVARVLEGSGRLLVGSYLQAADGALLDALGVTHVLCVVGASHAAPGVSPAGRALVRAHVMTEDEMAFPILECAQTAAALRFVFDALSADDKSSVVLVHCRAGLNRSAVLAAAAAAVWARDASCAQAVARLVAQRPAALSNAGFVDQLARFDAAAWRGWLETSR